MKVLYIYIGSTLPRMSKDFPRPSCVSRGVGGGVFWIGIGVNLNTGRWKLGKGRERRCFLVLLAEGRGSLLVPDSEWSDVLA